MSKDVDDEIKRRLEEDDREADRILKNLAEEKSEDDR